MSSTLFLLGSVALTEMKLRFRRSSTWVLFLLLCITAFLLMPDVGSGAVMFLIGDRRVLLNSAATSLTSALLGGFVLSLFGFYLISDSVTRDLRTGVGRLIAPSPVPSATYLAGKFLGNGVFLYAIGCIFMIACMLVHMVRGEVSLEPIVFAKTFALMFLPMGPTVAALAIMFECVPFLSGRGGDVLYFFFWVLGLSLPVALVGSSHDPSWLLGFDITGIGFFISNIVRATGSTHFTIGYAPYNAALSPVIFRGLDLDPAFVVPRMCSVLMALPLLGIALAAFRRFDPAAGKSKKGGSGAIARFVQKLRSDWLHGLVPSIGWLTGPPGLLKATILDAHLTASLAPLLAVVMIAASLIGILAPADTIRSTLMPVLFFLFVPALSSTGTRDRSGNVAQLIFSTPLVRRHYGLLKFLSSLAVILLLSIVPFIRVALDNPFGGVALLNGLVFVAASATFLGLLTGTPKAFAVVFLLFMYLAVSTRSEPAFDFAGLRGLATPGVIAAYAALSMLMIAATHVGERWREAREE
ncbi:MAG: hypothetical protein WB699_02645 [Bacteroidota bacterium]